MRKTKKSESVAVTVPYQPPPPKPTKLWYEQIADEHFAPNSPRCICVGCERAKQEGYRPVGSVVRH